jgi:uncharacterized protein (DUF1778 family)
MKKPRMGRPPFPKGKAKAEMVHVRLTAAEAAALRAAARASGQTLSAWARAALIAAAAK